MRIGIDGRLWNETGVGRYIRNLVIGLSAQESENEYVVFVKSKDAESVKSQLSPASSNKWKIVKCDIPWHSVKEQVLFPRVLYRENLDLMHFTYFSVPLLYNRPFVFTLHDLIMHHFPTGKASTLPTFIYRGKQLAYQLVIARAASSARKIIVPLEATKQDIMKTLRLPEEKVVVTREGYDKTLLSSSQASSEIEKVIKEGSYFLYVGNVYPHKNVPTLIEAFQMLKHDYYTPKIRLILVGKKDTFYQELEKHYQEHTSVVFLHTVTDTDLSYLYQKAIALVSPSLMEGFGLPPLEAMALSCPVIVSDIAAFHEVCGTAASYFNPHDIQAIVKKLAAVYNLEQSERKRKIELGHMQVKKFSWSQMIQQTLQIYESSISIRQGQ